MKRNRVKLLVCMLLILVMSCTSLAGCGSSNDQNYQNYVKALLDANYHGVTSSYVKITGAKKADALALVEGNSKLLAENLIKYYGFDIGITSDLAQRIVDASRSLYSVTKYEVQKPYTKDGKTYVDVKIYPEDFLTTSHETVKNYIDKMNQEIADGKYNDTNMEDYEKLFIEGVCDILDGCAKDMTYRDEVTVTVEIIQKEESYSISGDDMLKLEKALIYSE